MSVECCRNCKFWRGGRGAEDGDKASWTDDGQCLRYPPKLSSDAVRDHLDDEQPDLVASLFCAGNWFFPATIASDWCGEWKALVGTDHANATHEDDTHPVTMEPVVGVWR